MNTSDEKIQRRLAARGARGEPLSLITQRETLAELREMILEFSEACPAGQNHPHCPFRIMAGLSYDSLVSLINHLPQEACVNLFDQELACRSQADALCRKNFVVV